jgi:hypothetical protein
VSSDETNRYVETIYSKRTSARRQTDQCALCILSWVGKVTGSSMTATHI